LGSSAIFGQRVKHERKYKLISEIAAGDFPARRYSGKA
jgi:hypothetical protein